MFPVTRKRFTAYVFFQGAEHRQWWKIYTRRGWRHVFIVLPVHRGNSLVDPVYSLIINPLLWGIDAEVYFHPPWKLAQEALENGATCVVKIAVDKRFDREYVPRGLLTCVSVVKALLGISAWFVWTPEHLARYLLRNGGQLVEKGLQHGRTVRDGVEETETG